MTPHRRPVFLLAPARSYSTVALALLAGHPGLHGFPELMLFNADTVAEPLSSVVPGRTSRAAGPPAG